MTTSLNIVVVEDHDALREVTVEALQRLGHNARGISSAEALPDEPGPGPLDLLIIDLNLPGEDGLSLSNRIRAVEPHVGIIMVTARAGLSDRMSGYDSGADIYLTKPTSIEELLAAIRALTRRIRPDAVAHTSACSLNMGRLTLQGTAGTADVSEMEAAQLAAFARARNQQLESWQLIELTGREMNESSKKALEVQMVRLRKKLHQVGADEPTIKSLRGVGYRLCVTLAVDNG